MKNTLRVYFEMGGKQVDLNEISEKINLKPSFVRKMSEYPEVSQKFGIARDTWQYSTKCAENFIFQDEINDLIYILSNRKNEILELKKKHGIESKIVLVLHFYKNNPLKTMCLPEKCVSFLSDTQTTLDFDLYLY